MRGYPVFRSDKPLMRLKTKKNEAVSRRRLMSEPAHGVRPILGSVEGLALLRWQLEKIVRAVLGRVVPGRVVPTCAVPGQVARLVRAVKLA